MCTHTHTHTHTHHRFCGYILESGRKGGEKKFTFHGFRMEPNTDRLCLALHTACQARYQRVLDANPEASRTPEKEAHVGIGRRRREGGEMWMKREVEKEDVGRGEGGGGGGEGGGGEGRDDWKDVKRESEKEVGGEGKGKR